MGMEKTKDEGDGALSLEAVTKLMDEKIAAAATATSKRSAAALEQMFSKHVASLDEKLASLVATAKPNESKPDDKPDDAVKQLEAKYQAQVTALQKKMEERDRRLEEERQAREMTEQRTALSQALTAAGITGTKLKGVMAYFFEEKRIARDEKGVLGLRTKRDGYEETIPLEAGIAEWAKSDEGKEFVPARQVSGSGTTVASGSGAAGGGQSKGPMTDEQAAHELAKALGWPGHQ